MAILYFVYKINVLLNSIFSNQIVTLCDQRVVINDYNQSNSYTLSLHSYIFFNDDINYLTHTAVSLETYTLFQIKKSGQ